MSMWLSRDPEEAGGVDYYLWSLKPKLVEGEDLTKRYEGGKFGVGYMLDFCQKDFERITKIRLKPGELRRVRSIKIALY